MLRHWPRWGDALKDAGFSPNRLQGPRADNEVLEKLALFVRGLGHFPVVTEIKLRARTDKGFPWHSTLAKFGNKQSRVSALRNFCVNRGGFEDVVKICDETFSQTEIPTDQEIARTPREDTLGYVYLLKSGRFYKIGRTNAIGRRERELAIQLPEAAKSVHSIKTDDPAGIEKYWHDRFSARRKNGEWFELTAEDVAAFKRRKFM